MKLEGKHVVLFIAIAILMVAVVIGVSNANRAGVSSLGEYGSGDVYFNNVKLEEGQNITIISSDAHNGLVVSTTYVIPRAATVVVASDESSAAGQDQCDFLGEGDAIQDAVDSVTTGLILIQEGTYDVGTSITLKSGISLVGFGEGKSILAGTTSLANSPVVDVIGTLGTPLTDIEICGLTIDGTNMNRTGYDPGRKGISGSYVKRLLIHDTYVYDTPATGVGLDYLLDAQIYSCVTESCGTVGETVGGNGFGIGFGAYVDEPTVIIDCIAIDNVNSGFTFEGVSVTYTSEHHQIINCVSYGNRDGMTVRGAAVLTISGCSAYNNIEKGIHIVIWGTTVPQDVIIDSCMIRANGHSGILSATEGAVNVSISDSIISGNTLYGIRGRSNKFSVTDNIVYDNVRTGIYYDPVGGSTREYVYICENLVYNNGTGEVGGHNHGIRIEGGSVGVSDVVIRDNRAFDDQGAQTQSYGCIIGGGVVSNVTIEDNDFEGNLTGAFLVTSTGSNIVTRNNKGVLLTYEVEYWYARNTSGGSLANGDVVILKTASTGYEVTTTTAEGDDKVFGMVTETIASNGYGYVQVLGKTVYLKVDGTADIAVGDFLGTFSSAGIAMQAGAGDMVFAMALEAYAADDSNGVIDALIVVPRKI